MRETLRLALVQDPGLHSRSLSSSTRFEARNVKSVDVAPDQCNDPQNLDFLLR